MTGAFPPGGIVAVADPLNISAADDLRLVLGRPVRGSFVAVRPGHTVNRDLTAHLAALPEPRIDDFDLIPKFDGLDQQLGKKLKERIQERLSENS